MNFHGFRTCLLVSALSAGVSAAMVPVSELMAPPGWSGSGFAAGEELVSVPPCKVGDGELAAVDASGKVVLIGALDGTVKRRLGNPNGAVPAGSVLRAEGDFLFVTMVSPAKMEVDVCDLTTGEWRQRVSVDVPGWQAGSPVTLFYQGELRVITAFGTLHRWRADDLTPLEPRTYPRVPNSDFIRPVGTAFGEFFCAGIIQTGLLLERDGVWTVKNFPLGVAPVDLNSRMVVSESWMALDTTSSLGGLGVLVWNKTTPYSAPVQRFYSVLVPPTSIGTIVRDRYLLQQSKGADSPNLSILRVFDLANASRTPLSISLDMGNPSSSRVIGLADDHFWMFEKNTGSSASRSGGQILKHPFDVSTDFVSVSVADATATEKSGVIQFNVTADRALDHVVTLELATRDGIARGGSDFTAWSGTVTLTPASPSATVSITVLQDQKPETYESLSLDVISCTGAWIGRSSATGLIWDSPFRKLAALPPLPGESYERYVHEWGLVPSGAIVYSNVAPDGNENGGFLGGFLRARPGDKAWQLLKSVTFPDGGLGRVEDTFGDLVCFATKYDSFESICIVDASTDRFLGNYAPDGVSLALSDKGIVFFREGTPDRLEYHRFDQPGAAVWTKELKMSSHAAYYRISRYGEGQFIHSDVGGLLYVRNFSDGSIVRVIQPRMAEFEPVPVASCGDDSVIVTNASDFSSVAGPTGTTLGLRAAASDYLSVDRGAWITESGVTGHGVGWYPSRRLQVEYGEPDYVFTLVDRASGVKVGGITSMREIRQVHSSEGMIAYKVADDRLEILQTWMPLPEPTASLSVSAKESDEPVYLEFDLTEAVDFPLTASLVSTSPDFRAMAPVVVSPGSKKVRIPFISVRDSIPEKEEVFAITLKLSGDGVVKNHGVTVTVPANDHEFLSTPKDADIIAGNAVALHPSGIAIGNEWSRFVGDYRYQIAYPPDRGSKKPKAFFGHTVALDSTWLAVGAPFLQRDRERKPDTVFVYDRKSGKEKYTFSSKVFHEGFGLVLRLDKGRLVVGAPGIDRKGSVSLIALNDGSRKIFKQPGKSSKTASFGASVAIRGNKLWVGAPGHADGRVFQFDIRSRKLVREFRPPAGYQAFGHAMEIVGSRLAVSAPRQGGKSAVFLYNLNNGKAAGRIDSPFPDGGCFGASLAVLEGKVLVVGSPKSDFSPVGGLLLYGLSGNKPAFVTMLCPPIPSDWHDPQYYTHLGATASLSGAENVLGVTMGARRNVLDLQQVGREVTVIQLTTALKAARRMAPAAVAAAAGDPWEKALGAGASADDCPIRITTSGGKSSIVLPPIASVATGTRLVLEKSPDLAEWTPVAVLEGGDPGPWISAIEGLLIDSLSNLVELPMDSPSEYYRIRCEVP